MWDIVFKSLVTFFVIFGIIEMFSKCVKALIRPNTEKKEIFIFIHAKNLEESLEYIIRTTVFDYLLNHGGRTIPYIIVVDKGSQDRTREICQRLSRDYEFLYYTTEKEYNDFKSEIV